MIDALFKLDEMVFLWVNNRWSSSFMDALMTIVTVAGDWPVWLVVGLIAIWFAKLENQRRAALVFILTMLVAGSALHAIKQVAPRDRPLKHFQERIETGEVTVNTPHNKLYHRSFPSGHSQAAFTAAMFFALYFKRYWVLVLIAAGVVAISRVYLGVHFPTDIVVGSALGMVVAWVVYRLDKLSPANVGSAES